MAANPAQQPQPTTPACPAINEDVLLQAARDVWALYFEGELPVVGTSAEMPTRRSHLTACVSLKGDWNGGVLIVCPTEVVIDAAASLFGKQDESAALEAAKDLLGEITNTIAGSVTEVLPCAVSLSLPVIVHGVDLSVGIPDGKIITEVSLVYKSKPVHLMILEAGQNNL